MKKAIVFIFITALLSIVACKAKKTVADTVTITSPTYAENIERIVKRNCAGCHSGENPAGEVSLTSMVKVKAQAQTGNLLHRITDANNPMPPDGLLPESDRELLANWATSGFN